MSSALVMLENGLTRILRTDRHFDQLAEIECIDPLDFLRRYLRVGRLIRLFFRLAQAAFGARHEAANVRSV